MPARRTPASPVASPRTASTVTEPTTPTPERRTLASDREKDRRTTPIDRRVGLDRRVESSESAGYTGEERRSATDRRADTGLERRRGPGRRRADDRRIAEEGEMTTQQFEFVMAVETYKKVNKRLYPTWTEILEVMQQLGYRKVAHREITLENVPEPELDILDQAA